MKSSVERNGHIVGSVWISHQVDRSAVIAAAMAATTMTATATRTVIGTATIVSPWLKVKAVAAAASVITRIPLVGV